MIGLVVDKYGSVTVPHAINNLYPQINEYITIKVTVIIQKITTKIMVKIRHLIQGIHKILSIIIKDICLFDKETDVIIENTALDYLHRS